MRLLDRAQGSCDRVFVGKLFFKLVFLIGQRFQRTKLMKIWLDTENFGRRKFCPEVDLAYHTIPEKVS